jgi:hypothetical protein
MDAAHSTKDFSRPVTATTRADSNTTTAPQIETTASTTPAGSARSPTAHAEAMRRPSRVYEAATATGVRPGNCVVAVRSG